MLVESIAKEIFVLLDLPSKEPLIVLICAVRQLAARLDLYPAPLRTLRSRSVL